MKHQGPSSQRGISFFGLLFLGVVLALLAIVGARVVPTASEFMTIQKAVKKAAADGDTSPIKQALLKVKKATSYSDFADANGFNIRSVRRVARSLRDAGEIDLVKEGVIVYISPAV